MESKIHSTFIRTCINMSIMLLAAIMIFGGSTQTAIAAHAALQIDISGNKRTKDSYIEKLSHICLAKFDEERARALSTDAEVLKRAKQLHLQRCLNESGLFASVEVKELDAEKVVILVRDKWSFLVLPSYISGGNEESVVWGLLFFDFNLAGKGQLLGAIYQKQPESNLDSYSLLYDAPYLDKDGKYGFSMAIFDRKQNYFSYQGIDWSYRVTEHFRFIWLRLKHRITPKFSLTYGYAPTFLGFSDEEYRPPSDQIIENDAQSIENDAQSIQSITLAPEWSNLERRYYYDKGFRIDGVLYHQLSNSQKDDPDTALEFELYAGIPTTKQQVFQWGLQGGTRDHVERYNSWRTGGIIGARGVLDNGLWNQHYLISSFDYQVPITQGRYGYWNYGPFFDAGYLWNVQNNPNKELSYYSYGISSYVHLRQVNVPAFGVSIGSVDLYEGLFAQFFIGFRF
ncbi:MAG: hypothetical protein K0U41_05500 [Gammaproteobacteria bacterium]|nr:hypothetical protein [Gammaproteobacteria bacterium]